MPLFSQRSKVTAIKFGPSLETVALTLDNDAAKKTVRSLLSTLVTYSGVDGERKICASIKNTQDGIQIVGSDALHLLFMLSRYDNMLSKKDKQLVEKEMRLLGRKPVDFAERVPIRVGH